MANFDMVKRIRFLLDRHIQFCTDGYSQAVLFRLISKVREEPRLYDLGNEEVILDPGDVAIVYSRLKEEMGFDDKEVFRALDFLEFIGLISDKYICSTDLQIRIFTVTPYAWDLTLDSKYFIGKKVDPFKPKGST